MKLGKLIIFIIFVIISWILSILTVMAGEFAILSTAIYINMIIAITLILIYFKNG